MKGAKKCGMRCVLGIKSLTSLMMTMEWVRELQRQTGRLTAFACSPACKRRLASRVYLPVSHTTHLQSLPCEKKERQKSCCSSLSPLLGKGEGGDPNQPPKTWRTGPSLYALNCLPSLRQEWYIRQVKEREIPIPDTTIVLSLFLMMIG